MMWQRRKPGVGGALDVRMDDRFEVAPGGRVGENDRAQFLAIQRAGRVEHVAAKAFDDLRQPRSADGDRFARQRVGIDGWNAQPFKRRAHVALPGRNATRKRNPPHSVVGSHEKRPFRLLPYKSQGTRHKSHYPRLPATSYQLPATGYQLRQQPDLRGARLVREAGRDVEDRIERHGPRGDRERYAG